MIMMSKKKEDRKQKASKKFIVRRMTEVHFYRNKWIKSANIIRYVSKLCFVLQIHF